MKIIAILGLLIFLFSCSPDLVYESKTGDSKKSEGLVTNIYDVSEIKKNLDTSKGWKTILEQAGISLDIEEGERTYGSVDSGQLIIRIRKEKVKALELFFKAQLQK